LWLPLGPPEPLPAAAAGTAGAAPGAEGVAALALRFMDAPVADEDGAALAAALFEPSPVLVSGMA